MNDLLPSELEEFRRDKEFVRDNLRTFVEVGLRLLRIREKGWYRLTHDTFEGFCRDEWGMSGRHANRFIQSAEVVTNLGPMGPVPLTEQNITERQTRPLARLEPEQQREAWSLAVEAAPNGRPTAKHVEAAAAAVSPRPDERRREVTSLFPAPAATPPGRAAFPHEGDEDCDPTPPPPRPIPWLKFFESLNQLFVSLPRRGGIVNLTRNWTPKEVEAAVAHLEMLRDTAVQCLAELEERRP